MSGAAILRRAVQLKDKYPLYVANNPVFTQELLPVKDKFTDEVVSHVSVASPGHLESAIEAAKNSFSQMKKMPPFQRKAILLSIANELNDRKEELSQVLAIEVGKPIKDARVEIFRAVTTFQVAAEEATRMHGSFETFEITPNHAGFNGLIQRFPIGPISMICPFNFPINLAAHKIAPAIAVGCPFVLKPSDYTPISASILGDILSKKGLPEGSFSIVPVATPDASPLCTDERFKLLSFTGSARVGWALKSKAGKKKVALELGGNATCVVESDADLNKAIDRVAFGAFFQSGQSCISVQRVDVHESVYDKFKQGLIEKVRAISCGDPFDESTTVGPLISEKEAIRVEMWVKNAILSGARLLHGGNRNSSVFEPTILENVDSSADLYCEEIFGPVVHLTKFTEFKEACRRVNESKYGLQTGLFTHNINKVFYAFNEMEVGGLVINDVPSIRMDPQPYGGAKDSGFGREGLRYAMEEMTDLKCLTLKNISSL